MILAALLAELADMLSMNFATEQNPIVVAAGPYALPLKLLLMVVVAAGYLAYRARWRPVLAVAVVAGCVGAWSNLA